MPSLIVIVLYHTLNNLSNDTAYLENLERFSKYAVKVMQSF